jgi:hypothetical protein
VSQGLPGFRRNLSRWSYQRTFHNDKPDEVLCRLWWPRFVAELLDSHGRSQLGRVHIGLTISATALRLAYLSGTLPSMPKLRPLPDVLAPLPRADKSQ